MNLYYCTNCNVVHAFNLFDIQKHELTLPENMLCSNCGVSGSLIELKKEDIK